MAVTVADVALDLRLIADRDEAVPPGQVSIIERHLAAAQAVIDTRTHEAPEALRDQAAVAMAAYLYDRPSAAGGARFAVAWTNSGAEALLIRHVRRTARAIGTITGTASVGAGVDSVARALATANARRIEADHPRIPADPPEGAAGQLRVWKTDANRVPGWRAEAAGPGGGITEAQARQIATDIADDVVDAALPEYIEIWARVVPDDREGNRVYPPSDRLAVDPVNGHVLGTYDDGRTRWVDIRSIATGVGVLRGLFTPGRAVRDVAAWLGDQVDGERAGDVALTYDVEGSAASLYRYVVDWEEVFTWGLAVPAAWAVAGNGQGIPFDKLRPFLFDGEVNTPIVYPTLGQGGRVVIAFDVNNVPAGATVASPLTFDITADQAMEPDRQLRISYDLTRTTLTGHDPTALEIVLRHSVSGAIVATAPVKDEGADNARIDLSGVTEAATLRWAFRVATTGRYAGEIEFTSAVFHSSDGPADPFIRRLAAVLVSAEATRAETTEAALAARVAALEAQSGGGGGGLSPPVAITAADGRTSYAVVATDIGKWVHMYGQSGNATAVMDTSLGDNGDRIYWMPRVDVNNLRVSVPAGKPTMKLFTGLRVADVAAGGTGNIATSGSSSVVTFLKKSGTWEAHYGVWN